MNDTTTTTDKPATSVDDRMAKVRAARGKTKKPDAPKKAADESAPKPQKAEAQKPHEFEGLTAQDCCFDCNEKGCIISGTGNPGLDVCIHPCKGGMQAEHKRRPDVVARFTRARRYLSHQKVDKGV